MLGHNGSGKSTLAKHLNALLFPSEGEVWVDGMETSDENQLWNIRQEAGMIFQNPDNQIIGQIVEEDVGFGPENLGVPTREIWERVDEALTTVGMQEFRRKSPNRLSGGQKQRVSIAGVIAMHPKCIIMDEPTSAITDREVANLFRIIRRLKEKGTTIIYISHKMDEILEITDEITVLRDGYITGHDLSSNLTQAELIRMMVGRSLENMFPKTPAPIGEDVLQVEGLTLPGYFADVSFHVRRGEILGFAGLVGAGRSEVLETVYGLRRATAGRVWIHGKEVHIKNPQDAIRHGIGLLTEDRKASGCFLPLGVLDNIIMPTIGRFKRGPFVDDKRIRTACGEQKAALEIKATSLAQHIQYLSGGNQQKALIARWLINNPDILIVDEPTRGIDVNAKAEIHKKLCELARQGKAIIMVSSEMPEVIGMCDRMYVMHEGEVTGELMRDEFSQERIALMASLSREQLLAQQA